MKNWLKDEEKIRSLKLSKKACQYGKAKFPVIEKELFTKFFDMRIEDKRVKRWCFNSKEAMVSGELEWADITNTFLKCQEKPK